MFKKKPNIKTLSPLRSSDRRKTADRIIKDYGLEAQASAAEGDSEEAKAAAQAAYTDLRNSILPDNALSAKFSTTHGPQLQQVTGTVYVGSFVPGEQRVLWVKIDETLYPSVYTLWRNPRIVPLLHTPSLVVEKIKGGADLMTPGLAGPPFPPKTTKGSVVAVASLDAPSVPLVVGTCEFDISALKETRGAKGKAVEVFHWAGDDLWDWSTSGKPGIAVPRELEGWQSMPDGDAELAAETQELDIGDGYENAAADGGVSLTGAGPSNAAGETARGNGQVSSEVVETVDEASEPDLTTDEIDHAFKQAFLYGVHEQMQTNQGQSKYGFNFPLSQSLVMSNLVLPFLPAHTDKQAEQLTIKKTSWKNIKKFIKALHNDKIILSKDVKTELLVLDIDFEDPHITGFTPYRLPKRDKGGTAAAAAATKAGGASQNTSDDSIGQTLKVANFYKPRDALSEVFTSGAGAGGPKQFHTAADLKAQVSAYIESERLSSASNKRLVKLNPLLSNALFSTASAVDAEVVGRGELPREALVERVMTSSARFHLILRNDETPESVKGKPKAGPAPRVEIILETRSGNKTATRVHGFEAYYIPAQPLADELRKTCAGSTSVEPFKGGKGLEVMVQGPQREAVIKALEKRGVSKNWIDFADKTKGKKK